MKYGIVIAIIIIIGLIAGGVWWMMSGRGAVDQSTNTSEDSQQSENEADAGVVITYTDNGFRVSKDTVAVGSTILVINESSKRLQFSSNPHPQHTDNSELNLTVLEPGAQETVVVDKPGTWGFHNHLNDNDTGSITITN